MLFLVFEFETVLLYSDGVVPVNQFAGKDASNRHTRQAGYEDQTYVSSL